MLSAPFLKGCTRLFVGQETVLHLCHVKREHLQMQSSRTAEAQATRKRPPHAVRLSVSSLRVRLVHVTKYTPLSVSGANVSPWFLTERPNFI